MPSDSQRKIRIGVFGTYGFENMGDAAVADATIAGFKRCLPNAEMVGICQQPENVVSRHHIEAYSIHREFLTRSQTDGGEVTTYEEKNSRFRSSLVSFIKSFQLLFKIAKSLQKMLLLVPLVYKELKYSFFILKVVRSINLIVMSGSGQLNEEWGGPWRYPFGLFRWCLLARIAGCKIAFLSVGAGVLNSPTAKFFCRSALRFAHYKSVRDARTKNLLDSWGIQGVQIVPDMAFSLKFNPSIPAVLKEGGRTVGINPIPFCDPRTWVVANQEEYDGYIEKMVRFCNWLILNDYRVVFIPNELSMDMRTIKDLLGKIDGRLINKKVFIPEIINYSDVFDCYASCDFVVACRFHGLLFSYMSKKPVLSLAHHYKYRELAKEMGQEKYCLDISSFTFDEMILLFSDLVENKDENSRIILEKLENYSNLVENQYKEVSALAV